MLVYIWPFGRQTVLVLKDAYEKFAGISFIDIFPSIFFFIFFNIKVWIASKIMNRQCSIPLPGRFHTLHSYMAVLYKSFVGCILRSTLPREYSPCAIFFFFFFLVLWYHAVGVDGSANKKKKRRQRRGEVSTEIFHGFIADFYRLYICVSSFRSLYIVGKFLFL